MAEKIIPDVQFFAEEILRESNLDLNRQRLIMAKRLFYFPPEKFSEIHLEEWYGTFWQLTNISQQIKNLSEQEENICRQAISDGQRENNPARRQIFALLLLMFGKLDESQKLADQKLWSKKLNWDLETFARWNQLSIGLSLVERARIRQASKIKTFLREKFDYLVKKHQNPVVNNKTCPKVSPKDFQIYFCWLQGEENLPPLIRCCYNSLKMNAGNRKIIFLDDKNFSNYVDLPDYVVDKFREKKIGPAHFSDVMRINLLEKYGGLWLDSTILVTEPLDKHKDLLKLPYFTQKYTNEKDNFHPVTKGFGAYASYARWGTFIQGTSMLHNPFFVFAKEFCEDYWREFDEAIDYVIMDYMFELAHDNIPFVQKEMDDVPINNPNVWTLKNYLNVPYNQFPFDKIIKDTFLNKMSWRIPLDMDTPNTVFREIQRRYAPETIGKF